MRIGIVTGEYPPMQGGVGAFSQIIARKFVEQGHQVFVYGGTQAQDTPVPLTHHHGKWGVGVLAEIKRWAEQNHLDVINIQFQTAAFGMSPFIHFLPNTIRSIPVVTTFHDLRFPYLFPKAGKLRDWIVMHLARSSAGVIVTNHEDYERVKHLPNATMIPIGSNILTELPPTYDRNSWRNKAGAQPHDYLIAFFGFMNRSKGIELLLQSLANLIADDVPARLVLIGGRTGTSDPTNAAYAQEIETLIQKLNLTPYVCWTEFVTEDEVIAYLAASDVVSLPFLDGASFRRGTLMAAIYHHALIVTTIPQVPIREFVDGQNMFLVSPNVQSLTSALKNIRENPSLFRRKIAEGVMTLSDHFDWDNIARDTAAFFERVIHA